MEQGITIVTNYGTADFTKAKAQDLKHIMNEEKKARRAFKQQNY